MFKKSKPPAAPASGVTITVKDAAPCEKAITAHAAMDAVAPVQSAVVAQFQREAALDGFRKGKAPVELVQKKFGQSIHEETVNRMTRQVLEQAAKEHKLKPVGSFEVSRLEFQEGDGLTIEAKVEVEPAFALQPYKGLQLKRRPVHVTPADVDKALARLQESMAQLVPAGEGKPKERQLPPVDEELAKDVGFESLAKLREHLEAKLAEQGRQLSRQQLEDDLSEELIKRHQFDLPPKLVEHQAERLARDFTARLLMSGVPEDKVKEEMGKFTQQLRTSAERYVKWWFVLERIAAEEQVNVTQDELIQRLWQLSQRWKRDPVEVRKTLDSQGLWPSVISNIRQEKAVEAIVKSAVIEEPAADAAAGQAAASSSAKESR